MSTLKLEIYQIIESNHITGNILPLWFKYQGTTEKENLTFRNRLTMGLKTLEIHTFTKEAGADKITWDPSEWDKLPVVLPEVIITNH